MKLLRYVLVNGLFASCLYFGAYKGVSGAANIAMFIVWLSFVVSMFAPVKEVAVEISNETRPVPVCVDVGFDIAMTISMLWCGWVVSAIVYFIHMFLLHIGRVRGAELCKETS